MSDKKINISKNQTPMPKLSPQERINNFNEVEIGYTHEMAMQEACRCLDCKHKPCVSGCPVKIDIPEFIKKLKVDDIDASYEILQKASALPAVCGRVCPQERQCQAKCVRGRNGEPVAIGKLERYVSDNFNKTTLQVQKSNGCKVAVIGSGPSGITCARELALMGYSVTIYEALHKLGGVLAYGIPEFRLPRKILDKEIENLKKFGVDIQTNILIGRTFSIEQLLNEMDFNAIYIATGAGIPRFMGIPGEKLPGVYSANEFLTRINLMHAYSDEYDTPIERPIHTVVVGGGNVAMDAARCARRLGSKVTVVYRRTEKDMPARHEEIENAKEEDIEFCFLSNPTRILSDNGSVSEMECVKMQYIYNDSAGKKILSAIENEKFRIKTDCVIIAIGNIPNSIIKESTSGINFDDSGKIIINEETMLTSKSRVYAGGDIATGAATVILAMEAGKKAAFNINADLIKAGEVSC